MIASAFMNHFSTKNKAVENRLLAFLCLAGFFFGLPLCAQGGIFVFHAIENLNANWNSFSLALLSVTIVCFVYGIDNYLTDISAMLRVPRIPISKATRFKVSIDFLNFKPSLLKVATRQTFQDKVIAILGPGGIYIKFSLCFICPIILTVLLAASVLGYQRISFAGRPIPIDYEIVAWIVMIGPLLVVPLVAFLQVRQIRNEGKLLKSLFDTSDWTQDDGGMDEDDVRGVRFDKIDSPANRRRTPTIFTHRENTYMVCNQLLISPYHFLSCSSTSTPVAQPSVRVSSPLQSVLPNSILTATAGKSDVFNNTSKPPKQNPRILKKTAPRLTRSWLPLWNTWIPRKKTLNWHFLDLLRLFWEGLVRRKCPGFRSQCQWIISVEVRKEGWKCRRKRGKDGLEV